VTLVRFLGERSSLSHHGKQARRDLPAAGAVPSIVFGNVAQLLWPPNLVQPPQIVFLEWQGSAGEGARGRLRRVLDQRRLRQGGNGAVPLFVPFLPRAYRRCPHHSRPRLLRC